ncbi:hypothetical protein SAMN02745148_00733 [Modicisalibacter ilicicola DSM 19980]|uniref:Uncharacterized protein n=1 Tax=Modicisalibacter ilicicola DSM 19980 TaxID=1121942 RepID=A0A1M4UR60_9GAMM|nr:hypothetical protein [Halomonas ilicicola]SHE59231.1 hypothetical protein SAMN02745148_00733 [Halomonas ilicicola DSM 19980]
MSDEIFKNYVYDLGVLIKESAELAKAEKDASQETNADTYKLGYLMALHDVVSLMKEQADVFGIEQCLIGLDDIDPESELL